MTGSIRRSRRSWRRVLPFTALLAVTVLLAACGSSGGGTSGGGSGGGSSGGVVKLGFISTMSGPLAQIGDDMLDGAKVAVAQVNAAGGVDGGKKLQLVTKDDQLTPATGATGARDLVNSGVKLVFGMLDSAICLAVAPVVQSLGGDTIGSVCSSDPLVGPNRAAKNYWSLAITNTVSCAALAKVMATQYPDLKTVDLFGYDYITGHEIATECVNDLKSDGLNVTVRKSYFVPLTSETYTSQIGALSQRLSGSSQGRALFLVTYGAGTTAFLKQAAPFHLTSKYEVVFTNGGYVSSGGALNGAAPQVWDAYEYYPTVNNSTLNTQFVQQYDALKPADGFPNDWSYDTYMSVLAYAQAIDKAKSADPAAVATAMDQVTFDGPLGQVKFDPQTHESTTPVLVFQTIGDASSDTKLKLLKWDLVNPQSGQISKSGSGS
ncbi:MAG: ABC transporter substrate-binding protein [Actinomycetota bacterium]|nr:ABC transporter substrate-binding protein [Actinomycetota bacterium]